MEKYIDVVHNEIHESAHYTISYSATKNAGQNLDMLLTTPNDTKQYHFVAEVSANLSGVYYIYEAPTNVSGGTGLTVYNNNRLSSNTTACVVTHTPTVVDAGSTIIYQVVIGNSAPSNRSGGNTFARNEFILKNNTKYFIRFTADSNSTIITHTLTWYEVG